MQLNKPTSRILVTLTVVGVLCVVPRSANAQHARSATVYLGAFSPPNGTVGADVDYGQFARTTLALRLQQLGRLAPVNAGEPPCLPGPAIEPARSNADRSFPTYFRVTGTVQPRSDDIGRIFEVVLDYRAVSVTECQSKVLAEGSRAFPPEEALEEIRGMADAVAESVHASAVGRIPVVLVAPVYVGKIPARGDHSDVRNALAFALKQSREYGFEAIIDRTAPAYTIESKISAGKKSDVSVAFSVHSANPDVTLDVAPTSATVRTADDLTSLYFDAARMAVNVLEEAESRREVNLGSDPAEINAGAILRRARSFLCRDHIEESGCVSNPRAALAALNQLVSMGAVSAEAAELLGEGYSGTGAFDKAGAQFDAAARGTPSTDIAAQIRLLRASALSWYRSGKFDTAAIRYHDAIELSRAHANQLPMQLGVRSSELVAWARSERQAGNYPAAVSAVSAALALRRDSDVDAETALLLDRLSVPELERVIDTFAKAPFADVRTLSEALTRAGQQYDVGRKPADAARVKERAYTILVGQADISASRLALTANAAAIAMDRIGNDARALELHSLALEQGTSAWKVTDRSYGTLVENVARAETATGRFASAEGRMLELVRLADARSAPSDELVSYLNTLGTVYRKQFKFDDLIAVQTRALTAARLLHGEQSEEAADQLINLATACEDAGRLADAEQHEREAFQISQRVYGEKDPKTARAVNSYGLVQYYQGQYAASIPLFRRALELTQAAATHDPSSIGSYMHNLANAQLNAGDPAASEQTRRAMLAFDQLRPDHVLMANYGLGDALYELGRYTDAEQAYRTSLASVAQASSAAKWRRTYGLLGLGRLALQRRDLAALDLLAQARQATADYAGTRHFLYAARTADLAQAQIEFGNFAEAKRLLQEAVTIQTAQLGPEHPSTLTTFMLDADLKLKAGDVAAAIDEYRRVYDARVTRLPLGHPALALNLVKLSRAYEAQSDLASAEDTARHALDLVTTHLRGDHPTAGDAHYALARALSHQPNRYEAADASYARALEIYGSSFGARSTRLVPVLREYADLLRRQGRDREALDKIALADAIESTPSQLR